MAVGDWWFGRWDEEDSGVEKRREDEKKTVGKMRMKMRMMRRIE